MKNKPLNILILLALTLAPAGAVVRYVNAANSSSAPPYTSWASAARNIQDAIDVANAGDEIVVTNGVYATGGREVVVTKPLMVRSVNGPDVTIVDGGGSTRCVSLGDSEASLAGFTLTNGTAHAGAGVWCVSASSVVSNCVMSGNSADQYGGGAYGGTLNICTLTGNSSGQHGGGTYFCILNNCTLTGNSAIDAGGGDDVSTLNNCIIADNHAFAGGGADGSTLNNCIIADNHAFVGGGAYNSTLNNCTLTGNSADYVGGVNNCTVNNCIVYYNTATFGGDNYSNNQNQVNYSCTTPVPFDGIGNITAEPQLASASHLSVGSPCRGAGSAAYSTGLDIDGQAWANPPSIGCDEFNLNLGAASGPLSADFTESYVNVATGFEVNFTSHISGYASASRWDFGDGTVVSNRLNTAHAWTEPGDYSVVLRAYNESYPEGVSATGIVHVVEQVRYVSLGSRHPVVPYDSWATAATNIQDAVGAASVVGALVLVSNGVYHSIVVVSNPLTIRSANGPDVTVINGGGTQSCVYLGGGATLAGVTLTNGGGGGGGVECASADSVVSNCVITGNSAAYGGGASGGTLYNCALTGNSAASHGGGASYATLYNCTLTGNSAAFFGGGASYATLYNCTLTGNSASVGGGASRGRLINCVLTGNSAGDGGGVSGSTLYNCTLTHNSAATGGGGAGQGEADATFLARFYNCIVYSNQAPIAANYGGSCIFAYSCTTPLPPGASNIDADPGFRDQAAGDFRLRSCSPCIDAGMNFRGLITTDLEGTPRPLASDGDGVAAFDMGAYEFDPRNVVVPPDPLAILREVIGGDGKLHVPFGPSRRAAYYILYRGASVTHIDTPVAIELGAGCASPELIDPTPVAGHGMAFYRVREVPISPPLDSDGDGIDDVYELRHARFLNPLDPADAAQDFDGDGISNLQEYLAGTNPALPPPRPVARLALAVNDQGWFALKTNGSLWFFDVSQNQLQRVGGNSNYDTIFPGGFPVATADDWVAGSRSYSPGQTHILALKADGGLWAWGDNSFGQLGDGTYAPSSTPVRISTDTDWSSVAAGTGFSTAIKSDGRLWAWGWNGDGELGNGTNDQGTTVPIQIGTDHDWGAADNSKSDPFDAYTLALKSDGTLWSWGAGPEGELGLGIGICCTNSPTRVGADSDWRSFSAGALHVIALKTTGSLWSWGYLSGGDVPTRIGSDTNWVAVAAGFNISTALKDDGTLWSWSTGDSPQQVGTDTDWGSPP